jgi:hypothetical protein
MIDRDSTVYVYGVPGGALNLNSTDYPDLGHHGDPLLSGKNPHGRDVNRTQDLMISSPKCQPLDHEAGPSFSSISTKFAEMRLMLKLSAKML